MSVEVGLGPVLGVAVLLVGLELVEAVGRVEVGFEFGEAVEVAVGGDVGEAVGRDVGVDVRLELSDAVEPVNLPG